jgi:hypothetical protein
MYPITAKGEHMNRYRVTILATPDSTTYAVDTIVETKQSAKAVINRFLRKHFDCYEITVEPAK